MQNQYDLVGLGIGPFHLSLAALLKKAKGTKALFLDKKPDFQWHQELMFNDAEMQTSFLKDLVTPVDPTSPYSVLNYLVEHGLFYSFMNTGRRFVGRREFELYCQWVSSLLKENLRFESEVKSVDFDRDRFIVKTNDQEYTSSHLSIATGHVPHVPEFVRPYLNKNVFHAKSPELQHMDLREKRVLIIGGGQTGVEIFRNAVNGKWGRVKNIRLISRRQNLEPLDDSPFTNEYFSPSYVNEFFPLEDELKRPIVEAQKFASDGNTPHYLNSLYNELYQLKYVLKDELDFKILPHRNLVSLEKNDRGYLAVIENNFLCATETIEADVVILSTGFKVVTPKVLDPLKELMCFDPQGRFLINQNFDLQWKGPTKNKIYALNFSRHRHGIAEPQTSLMAWRSATIINDMAGTEIYNLRRSVPAFVQYGKYD